MQDMMDGEIPVEADGETFNTYLFMQEAAKIIQNQQSGQPFFLYYSLPLMHMPVIADDDILGAYEDVLSRISNVWRRKTAAMAIMLDLAVEHIIDALTEVVPAALSCFLSRAKLSKSQARQIQNTIIVFASDNGAQVEGSLYGAGSNFPLRGAKGSLYEGGSRVPAFIFSPLLGHVLPLKITDGGLDGDLDDTVDQDLSTDDGESALQGRVRKLVRDLRNGDEKVRTRRRLLSTYNITHAGGELSGLFHVSDWVPTLLAAIGQIDVIKGKYLDGINQWDYFIEASAYQQAGNYAGVALLTPPRTGFLYNAGAALNLELAAVSSEYF
jgi:hypothetical protein